MQHKKRMSVPHSAVNIVLKPYLKKYRLFDQNVRFKKAANIEHCIVKSDPLPVKKLKIRSRAQSVFLSESRADQYRPDSVEQKHPSLKGSTT